MNYFLLIGHLILTLKRLISQSFPNVWGFEILWAKNPPTFSGQSSRKAPHSIGLSRSFSPSALRSWHIKWLTSYGRNGFGLWIKNFFIDFPSDFKVKRQIIF